jgi:hypothetical protein
LRQRWACQPRLPGIRHAIFGHAVRTISIIALSNGDSDAERLRRLTSEDKQEAARLLAKYQKIDATPMTFTWGPANLERLKRARTARVDINYE